MQIYGQVNKALLFWDDGDDSDVYVVDNDYSGGRIGFEGSATLKPGWTAGYNIEFNYKDSASTAVSKDDDEGNANDISIRKNYLYIESEQLGRFSIGQRDTATDGTALIVLGNSLREVTVYEGAGFEVVSPDGVDLTLGELAVDFTSARNDIVRYDSPSIFGFIISAAWGDDDFADIALRYEGQWNSIKLAAGIGYQWDSQEDNAFGDFEVLDGSVSILHVPTGLYGHFAAGEKTSDDDDLKASYYYIQAGIEKQWLPYGTTTIYGEYGEFDDLIQFATGVGADSSNVERWGFGVVQKFDSAALELYAHAQFFDIEATVEEDTDTNSDVTTVLVGSRIKF